MATSHRPGRTPQPSRALRWALGGVGFLCVGLAILGALLPGLPTTIFLLAATWCFARSYPSVSRRVLALRIFRPVRAWVIPGARVSPRAKATALVLMWAAIALTVHLLASAGVTAWASVAMGSLGVVGTWFIARHGRMASSASRRRD